MMHGYNERTNTPTRPGRSKQTTRNSHEYFCLCGRVRDECGLCRGGMVVAVVVMDRRILVESLSRSALTSSTAAFTPTPKEGVTVYGLYNIVLCGTVASVPPL
mmetsp:Transcript_46798/g.53107  ORF Transcript_46798/g.53107 Transcript_46798/m.53107 type:complete len:103 (-) Transcript_46798:177-485(-)